MDEEEVFRHRMFENEYDEIRFNEERRRALQRKKLFLLIVLLAPIPFALGIFLDISSSLRTIFTTFSAVAIGGAALLYLQPNSLIRYGNTPGREYMYELDKLRDLNRGSQKENKDLKRKIDSVLRKIEKGSSGSELFTARDKENLLNEIRAGFETDALSEYHSRLVDLTEERLKSKTYDDYFNQMANRLSNEVQALAKRGNLNLILGITTTLSGLFILGYAVFDAPEIKDAVSLGSHFVPKISLVIFIEVFAYFFLSLYKQSLSEIKYFQNELTNIEAKYLAVKLALAEEGNELVKSMAEGLLSTERNFLLKKGESTVELEKQRMDSNNETKLEKILDKFSVKSKTK